MRNLAIHITEQEIEIARLNTQMEDLRMRMQQQHTPAYNIQKQYNRLCNLYRSE